MRSVGLDGVPGAISLFILRPWRANMKSQVREAMRNPNAAAEDKMLTLSLRRVARFDTDTVGSLP